MAILEGSVTGNKAEVDSNLNLKVNLPTSATQSGYIIPMIENDNGSLFGSKKLMSPFVTQERRLSVGIDTPLYDYTFNATSQDTGSLKYITSTMTTTWGTTGMLLNASSTLTAATGTCVSTYRQFPLTGNGTLVVDMTINFSNTMLANENAEFGLFPFTNGTTSPTEGAYFRLTSGGLFGGINFNGTETLSGQQLAAVSIVANTTYVFTIRIHERLVSFWKDGVLLANGELTIPIGNGQPFVTGTLPLSFQFRNSGAVTGTAVQMKVCDTSIDHKSLNIGKPFSHIQASKGLMGYQGTNGNAMGSTALYTNSLAAGAGVVMTNTTAALGTGLGGQFGTLPTLAAGTDGIVSSYQVPIGSVNITPRTLYITGVKIHGAVTTVLAGNATPVLYAYSLAFGHTAVSLATVDGVASKAPRRIALGYESYAAAAAVGTLGQGVTMKFDSPIVVNPGEFVAIVAKNQGVVTTTGVITLLVTFDSYWE